MQIKFLVHVFIFLMCFSSVVAQWRQTDGPYGGNVSSMCTTSDAVFAAIADEGVYRSTNEGKTWRNVSPVLKKKRATAIVSSGQTVYAVMGDGLFSSTDDGSNWKLVRGGNYKYLSVRGSTILMAAETDTILVSKDGGNSWVSYGGSNQLAFSSVFVSKTQLLVGCSKGRMLSSDGGVTWSTTDLGMSRITSYAYVKSDLFCARSGWVFVSYDDGTYWTSVPTVYMNVHAKEVASDGKTLYMGASDAGVWSTNDGGYTWKQINTNIRSQNVSALCVSPPYVYAGTSDDGIFVQTIGSTYWYWVSEGLKKTAVQEVRSFNGGLIARTGRSIYNLYKDGWRENNDSLADWQHSIATTKQSVYVGTYYNGLYRQTSPIPSWKPMPIGAVYPGAIDTRGDTIYAAGGSQVWRSTDDGENWKEIGWSGFRNITAVCAGPSVLCVADEGSLYFSSNQGASWRKGYNYLMVYSIFFQGDILYLCDAGSTKISRDQGLTWSDFYDGTAPGFKSLSISNGRVFGITRDQIHILDTVLRRWVLLSSMLPVKEINSVYSTATTIYASTESGIWYAELSDILASVGDDSKKQVQSSHPSCLISSLQPNPSDDRATLLYTLESAGQVSVQLYDAHGRLLRVLLDDFVTAGTHTVEWDTSVLESGVYMCRILHNNECVFERFVVHH